MLPMPSRAFVADTTALVIFFTVTGILNKRFVAGMDWQEVATARLIGAPLMVATARPYGWWRDRAMRRTGSGRMSRIVWDTVALLSFQTPIYGAIIAAGGASGSELIRGVVGAAILMLALGRPYGIFLDWIRRLFDLPPGGMAPMSPGG